MGGGLRENDRGFLSYFLALLDGFRKEFDYFAVESRDVIRFAAAYPVAVADDFAIFPSCAAVADVVLQRWPTGHDMAPGETG